MIRRVTDNQLVKNRFAFLKLRDLRCVFGATLVSQLGDGVVNVALAFAVLNLTHGSATDLAVVFALRTVAQVSGLLIGGVVADRVSRRGLMMASDLTRFVGQAVIGVLLVTHDATLLEVIVSQMVLGAAGGFFNPASAGLIPAVAGDYLQEANAMQGIAGASSGIAGAALGGVLATTLGPSAALLVDAGSYALSALFLSLVSSAATAVEPSDEPGGTFLSDLKGGFAEVRSRSWLWSLIISFAFTNALAGSFEVLGPLICRKYYDGPPAFALLSVMFGVGAIGGGFLLLHLKPKRPLLVGVTLCLPLTLPSFLLAAHAPLVAILPFSVLGGAGPIMFNTLWWTTLQQHVPREAISRVISFDFAGSYALSPLGVLAAGPVAVAIGVPAAFVVFGGAGLLVTASNFLNRDVRTLKALPPSEADGVVVAGV